MEFLIVVIVLLLLVLGVLLAALVYLGSRYSVQRREMDTQLAAARAQARANFELAQKGPSDDQQAQAQRRQDAELDLARQQQLEVSRAETANQMGQWKAESESAIRLEAQQQLQQWRDGELNLVRQQQLETARAEAANQLAQWKAEAEAAIRQDAVNRSRAVIAGKVTEHFIPYLPDFPFNPKDARFIGTPVDMIIFDGMDAGELQRIVLLEVKTGRSGLSSRERKVRDVIEAGKLEWLELRQSLDFTAVVTATPDGQAIAVQIAAPDAAPSSPA